MRSVSVSLILIIFGLNIRYSVKGVGTLKYGDIHEKFIFLETQDSKPFTNGQKHFETILPNSPPPHLMSVKFKENTQWYKFIHVATALATAVYYKNMTNNID